jgi:hypothetical protein
MKFLIIFWSFLCSSCLHNYDFRVDTKKDYIDYYFTSNEGSETRVFSLELSEDPRFTLFKIPEPFHLACYNSFKHQNISCTQREEKRAKLFLSAFIDKWQRNEICAGQDFLDCFHENIHVQKNRY